MTVKPQLHRRRTVKLVKLTVNIKVEIDWPKRKMKIVWDKLEGQLYLSAVASGGLCGKSLYLLSVQLSSSAVVLGIGSIGCAPMLTEKCHLPQEVGKETGSQTVTN